MSDLQSKVDRKTLLEPMSFCEYFKTEEDGTRLRLVTESEGRYWDGRREDSMKTLEALYQEILASEELQKNFAEAIKEDGAEDFLKANGCEAAKEELKAFLLEKQNELTEEELDSVSGGISDYAKEKLKDVITKISDKR